VPGSLSMADAAILFANVMVVDSVQVGRSALYNRYSSGPRTLPWGTPCLTKESYMSNLTRKCLLCR
jgi:hypothetical protein